MESLNTTNEVKVIEQYLHVVLFFMIFFISFFIYIYIYIFFFFLRNSISATMFRLLPVEQKTMLKLWYLCCFFLGQ